MGLGSKHTSRTIQLNVNGPFRLSGFDGKPLPITSKRSKALLAILATSKNMEKTRAWLQNTLWCDRSKSQSQASLRRELSNLRVTLRDISPDLVWANKEMIGLNTDLIKVDISQRDITTDRHSEILEGFDLPNEENFEIWLRNLRNEHSQKVSANDTLLNHNKTRVGQPSLSIWPNIKGLSNEGEILISGIVDTLFEHLPKLRWLDLINSPWRSVTNEVFTDATIAEKLNVTYLLKCRCTENFKNKTVHFKLLKIDQNKVLWTENIELNWPINGNDLKITIRKIVANIQTSIQATEQLRVTELNIPNLNVNSLVWRARWHMKRLTKEDANSALSIINTALHRSPDDKEALLQKAFIEGWNAWVAGPGRDEIKRIRRDVHKVRDLDPLDARPYLLSGIFEHWLKNHAASHSLLTRATELNPCLSDTYGHLAACYNCWGKPELAIEPALESLRLDPLGMENFFQLSELGLSYFMLEQFEEAIEYCDQALALKPRYLFAYAIKIASHYYKVDIESYEKARNTFFNIRPNFTAAIFEWLPFEDRGWIRKLSLPLLYTDKSKRF